MSLPLVLLALIQAETWNIAGSLLAGLGASLALFGSLTMAHTYLAMPLWEFILQAPRYILLALLRKRTELQDEVELARANEERRVDTLMGLCQLVFGFFLQILGIVCLYVGTLPDPPTK